MIIEAYRDPAYERTFMIIEAASIAAAQDVFSAYPQVPAGLIAFEFVPLIGLPAVAMAHEEQATRLPPRWPPADR